MLTRSADGPDDPRAGGTDDRRTGDRRDEVRRADDALAAGAGERLADDVRTGDPRAGQVGDLRAGEADDLLPVDPRGGGTAPTPSDRLRGLVAMARGLTGARTAEEVVVRAAWAVHEVMGASAASVSRWERDAGLLRKLVNVGDLAPGVSRRPADEVVPARDSLVLMDPTRHAGHTGSLDDPDLHPSHAQALRNSGKHSFVEVPIVLDDKVWGILLAARHAGTPPFGPEDLQYAAALAGQVAAGLAQSSHFEQVSAMAYVDPLTGLANRRALDERLDAAMDARARDGVCVSLVMCDVNGLKHLNDTRGHKAGDRLLVAVAGVLSAAGALLPGSLVARLGGDEFAILAVGPPADDVIAAATEVCERAAALDVGNGVSCGVVCTDDQVGLLDTSSRLLRLADAAQYRAKRAHSTVPVVAGRAAPEEVATAVPMGEEQPGRPDRRRTRSRSAADGLHVLRAGLEAIEGCTSTGTHARLECLADSVSRLLDAAAWFVSFVPPGGSRLRTVGMSALRPAVSEIGAVGEEFVIERFPATARALKGGGFAVRVGDPDADPAEDAILVSFGFTGAAAGGVSNAEGGWLIEVCTDEISARVDDLAPVMQALVAVAAVIPHPAPDAG